MLAVTVLHLSVAHLLAGTTGTGAIPVPGTPSLPGNAEAQLNTVLGWIKYLGLAAAFVGLFLTAAKMAVAHRTGQGGEHLAGLGYVAGALVLLGSASALIGFFA